MSESNTKYVPRDPSHYRLSMHAAQRRKNRGITFEQIANTIESGIVQEAKGGHPTVEFVHVPMGSDEAVGVVANAADGTVKTCYWAYECTHPKIVELRKERGLINSSGVTS